MKNNILRISILFAFIIFFQVGNAVQAKNAGTEVKASFSNNTNNVVDELEDYVGRYRIERTDFEYATVTFENGKLYGKAEGQERVELVPQDQEGHFYVPSMDVTVRFIRDDDNEVSGVTIVTNEGTLRGEKVR
ncbi:hypothetical protein BH23BAC1_BH23BAC1_04410 [soil metagenome]